jgi:hypothetical protein
MKDVLNKYSEFLKDGHSKIYIQIYEWYEL